MRKIVYQPAGVCIYCGCRTGKLSMEHILAKSLGGKWELPRASCANCAEWTSNFERAMARDFYGALRATANYPSRRKKDRPKHFVVDVISPRGLHSKVVVPVADYPSICPAVTLPEAGILTGAPLSDSNPEMQIGMVADDPGQIARLLARFEEGSFVKLAMRVDFSNFALTLAKTAHAFTVANLGFDGYEPFLPEVVRGLNPHLSHFVGGWPYAFGGCVGNPTLGMTIKEHRGYLLVLIELFHGRLQPFAVVAGRITDLNLLGHTQANSRIVCESDFAQTVPHWEDELSSSCGTRT